MENKGIYNKNRCNIFNFIIENPGKHFSDIKRKLNLTKRGLGYHLEKMVKEGLITEKPQGIFKFYYPANMEQPASKLTPMQQRIFDIINEEPCTTDEIADVMDKSKRSVEYHLGNLSRQGYIVKKKTKKKGFYWHAE